MITITGEVRKVLDDQYTDGKGNKVAQAVLVIEPSSERKNYEVFLSAAQVRSGAKDAWLKLVGQSASVPVSLYVNHEYRLHKFNAAGDGMAPTTAKR
ncbi:MAG TPA: hypothetical protein PLF22_03815 [Pseudomonadales bacterium]|nr:hypothetical protein [Pseudomonadales bacterium]